MLTLLLCICSYLLNAQDLKIIKTVDRFQHPIPYVELEIPGMDMMLSDSLGCVIIPDNLNEGMIIAFEHRAFHSKYVLVKDLKESIVLLKKNEEGEEWSNNERFDRHIFVNDKIAIINKKSFDLKLSF